MKKKIIIFILFAIFTVSVPKCCAIPTTLPQNNITLTEEEAFNNQTQNLFFRFLSAIINVFKGNDKGISIKSSDVKEFSSDIKAYQAIEEKNDPDYKNSHAKEKADFGTGILDIIAGILSIFGL
jgi:hypothetical protein